MPRILVVDDHRDVRAMISMLLRVNHFEVIEAESVAAGLKAFEDARFDVAIVDIFLSDACGFDLITAMRERAPRLAVVAVSGMAALDSVSQSSELSDVVCLQKPFRPTDLIRAVSGAREAVSRSAGANSERPSELQGNAPGDTGAFETEADVRCQEPFGLISV